MSSNAESPAHAGRSRQRYVLVAALIAAGVAGLAAVLVGPAVGAGLVPLAVAAVAFAHSFARRNDLERTDERARMLALSAKAASYDALLGLVLGTAIYQWIAHGRTQAEPMLYVGVAAIVVLAVISAVLRRRA